MAHEAVRLAGCFGVDPRRAETAALLHGAGGIVSSAQTPPLCQGLNLPTVPEERQVPTLLHAKLSVVPAREVYGVTDTGALQPIRYHTTLHAQPTPLEWDQGGLPPYHAQLLTALESGLEAGARRSLTWMASPQA